MANFVEFTDGKDEHILVNIDHISFVERHPHRAGARIYFPAKGDQFSQVVEVNESYERVVYSIARQESVARAL